MAFMTQQIDPYANNNLPDWMKSAMQNVGQIGPGAASYVSSSGPQELSKLQQIWDASYGKAQSQLDPNAIKSVFGDSIAAAMQLGGEQINSAEGDRGAAVRPGGVATQKMMDLGLKVQQPLVEALLGNMQQGLAFNQGSLGKLFDSASGSQSNSLGYRNTIQDINSQLPPYVQQSNPSSKSEGEGGSGGASGGGGGGGNSGSGSGTSSGAPWWQTSYAGMGSSNSDAMNKWNAQQPDLPPLDGQATGPDLNFAAGETPTGGGGHGLSNIYDASLAQKKEDESTGYISGDWKKYWES